MSDTTTTPRAREAGHSALRPRPPFNARPVCAAGRESRSTEGPYATHYTAVASWLYINRLSGSDRFGAVPDAYVHRGDLVAAGRCHPQKLPPRLRSGDTLWREADDAAAIEGPRAIAATHIVADLPPDADPARWTWLVEQYAYGCLVDKGMIVDWSIHHRRRPTASSRACRMSICSPRPGSGVPPGGSARASGNGSPTPTRSARARTTGSGSSRRGPHSPPDRLHQATPTPVAPRSGGRSSFREQLHVLLQPQSQSPR